MIVHMPSNNCRVANVTEYLSIREAASSLGVPRNTLMAWVYGCKIRAIRRGYWWFIHTDEVERKRGELST